MAKIKYKIADADAFDSGYAEPPKPGGPYAAKVAEINAGFSKGDDGKPDKNRPRLQVITEITDVRFKGARVWDYITFSPNTEWKLANFLTAFGLGDKGNPSGEFDTKKLAPKGSDVEKNGKVVEWTTKSPGAPCRVVIRGGTDQNDNYRAEIRTYLPVGEDDEEPDADDFDDNAAADVDEADGDDDFDEGDGDDADADDEDDEMEDDEDEGHTEEELKAMVPDDLKALAKELDIKVKGKKKSEVIALILAAESAEDEDDDDDDEEPF